MISLLIILGLFAVAYHALIKLFAIVLYLTIKPFLDPHDTA